MEKIAFIGTGTMGSAMASNIIKKGYSVIVHSKTKTKAVPVLSQGATWAGTANEAVQEADYAITMVGDQNDVRDIYLGENCILKNMKPGSVLIDMTTSSPKLAVEIQEKAKNFGIEALDAPVTGGPIGAIGGSLTIMVGGNEEPFTKASDLLSCMGEKIIYYGPAGNGQRAKLVNQTVGMLNMLSAIEGVFFAKKSGLDTEKILDMLQSGLTDSKSLRGAAPMALKGDYKPNFQPKHVVKDLSLAIEEADSLGLDLPILKSARERWIKLINDYPNAGAVHEVARLYQ